MSYVSGPALLAACSSGRGSIVIVEGETAQEDAYFYGQWFGSRGRDISFFPQNGWSKVVTAVADLRQKLPHRSTFGIIDRDFVQDAALQQQTLTRPTDFVFRTPRFTIENYLLDADGWFEVIKMLSRASAPSGWTTQAEVQARIEDAYKQCMDLAAFNYTVRREYDRQPGSGIEYKRHPNAITKATIHPERDLLAWGQARSAPVPLDQEYNRHRAMMRTMPRDEWPCWITGKAVLKVFLESFPPRLRNISHDILQNFYMDKRPVPPPDLALIVERIIDRDGNP